MAHYKLGLALLELDRTGEAIDEFERSLNLQPGLANGHFGVAKAYLRTGQAELALTTVDKCLTLDPTNESAQYLRAQILRKLGRQQEAEEQLARLRILRENSRSKH
jgi:tetratricopeptide (TPR) repeat protein